MKQSKKQSFWFYSAYFAGVALISMAAQTLNVTTVKSPALESQVTRIKAVNTDFQPLKETNNADSTDNSGQFHLRKRKWGCATDGELGIHPIHLSHTNLDQKDHRITKKKEKPMSQKLCENHVKEVLKEKLGHLDQTTQKLPTYHLKELLAALAIKESNGDPDAINEQEEAWGLYQIRPIYLKDVNQIMEKDSTPWFERKDCFNPATAAIIVAIYLNHYGLYDRIRPESHDEWQEIMARMHNGGPNGHKKQATEEYGKSVMNIIKKGLISVE